MKYATERATRRLAFNPTPRQRSRNKSVLFSRRSKNTETTSYSSTRLAVIIHTHTYIYTALCALYAETKKLLYYTRQTVDRRRLSVPRGPWTLSWPPSVRVCFCLRAFLFRSVLRSARKTTRKPVRSWARRSRKTDIGRASAKPRDVLADRFARILSPKRNKNTVYDGPVCCASCRAIWIHTVVGHTLILHDKLSITMNDVSPVL